MNFRQIFANIVIFGFLTLPFIMFISWVITPKQRLNVLIFDKTVLTEKRNEHLCFNWILKHQKITNIQGDYYKAETDYCGFFPLKNKKFQIRDFLKSDEPFIEKMSNFYDMVYYTENYGVYRNEWYLDTFRYAYSRKIYGGLDHKDFEYLKKMKEKKKLILAEFNFFAPPTSPEIRKKTEELFGLKWTGWTGRYFPSLALYNNKELPPWAIILYEKQYQKKWRFSESGIVLVNSDETIIVLENQTHLNDESPVIHTFPYGQKKFNLPVTMHYPYWFDITLATDTTNNIVSYYKLEVNHSGDSLLRKYNVPAIFPAVFENKKNNRFYYFSGDFCDNPINDHFAFINGIGFFEMLALNTKEQYDRSHFFWLFYKPLIEKILTEYCSTVKK